VENADGVLHIFSAAGTWRSRRAGRPPLRLVLALVVAFGVGLALGKLWR
jgi:hypothetical protein